MKREKSKWRTHKDESTDAGYRGGIARSSEEVFERRRSEGAVSFCFENWSTKLGGTNGQNKAV